VVDVAYRGRGYDHVVSCGGALLTAVFAARPRARGTVVRLALDPVGCMAFPIKDSGRYDGEVTTVMAGAVSAAKNQGVAP
jgi:hypothetical protein